MMEKTIRCTDCYAEFSEDEVGNRCHCPACGTKSVPMAIKEDVLLPINAEGLEEEQSRIVLHKIIKRLDKHRPPGACALTLVGEIKELQDEFPTASLYVGDECIVPPKEEVNEDGDSDPEDRP